MKKNLIFLFEFIKEHPDVSVDIRYNAIEESIKIEIEFIDYLKG